MLCSIIQRMYSGTCEYDNGGIKLRLAIELQSPRAWNKEKNWQNKTTIINVHHDIIFGFALGFPVTVALKQPNSIMARINFKVWFLFRFNFGCCGCSVFKFFFLSLFKLSFYYLSHFNCWRFDRALRFFITFHLKNLSNCLTAISQLSCFFHGCYWL